MGFTAFCCYLFRDLILVFCFFSFQNSSFSISWLPLKGLTYIIKSPLAMLEMVKTCCCDKQGLDLYKSSSSYTIFLCILAKVVKKAMKNNGPHPWKQVKGRWVLYLSLSWMFTSLDKCFYVFFKVICAWMSLWFIS